MKTARFIPSALDRLAQPAIHLRTRAELHKEIADNIRQNLTALFKTRRYPLTAPASGDKQSSDLSCYGLPEIAAIGAGDQVACNLLLATITRQISKFEPRLQHVHTSFSEKKTTSTQCLELIIEAELRYVGEQQVLAFRSVIYPFSRFIKLEEHYAERISRTLS